MARSPEDPKNPWLYNPSLAAAAVIAHIYLLTTAVHIFQAHRCKARYCIPLIIGGAWETIGYGIRGAATRNEHSVGLYATQQTLIVLAPACELTIASGIELANIYCSCRRLQLYAFRKTSSNILI